ncbi:MAG: serine hydrolase domain-containing protein [Balneolaceae bacterium]|nr:serine hydrolase domain-containing protein [Balneolaceae bacterium]
MKYRPVLLVFVFIFVITIFGITPLEAQTQDVPTDEGATPLLPKQTVSDSLSTGDLHTYTVDIEANEFVYGEALQQTVDVVVTVYGPDGTTLDTFDNLARGAEPFLFSSDTTGRHRIEIKPFEEQQGRYSVSIERIEPVATAPAERVDQLMAAYAGEDVPGGVVGVIRDGEIVFSEGYGMANLTYDVPFTTDTPSNIGSVSKQFTAFAIMLLAEQSKLSLDDPVREHIPELPAFDSTVTLRHLLTHTSGYREYLNTLALGGRRILEGDHISPEEVIDIVQRQPELQNAPGAEWNYNNTGYNLLSMVVDRVTDQTFPTWMEKNVFEPLGMSQTLVSSNRSQVVPRSAQGYTPAEDGGYRNALTLDAAMGAGGITRP